MAENTRATKPRKGRSPGYPGIDLCRALQLARAIYDHTGQHSVAPEVAFEVCGLKPKSSQALISISALKKFGLIEAMPQRGPDSGKVRVSDLAVSILLDEREDSADREKLVQRAALEPSIHNELWEQYRGKLPGDAALRFHLQRDRKFTESGAADFIVQFRSTIAFAKLDAGSVKPDGESDKVPATEDRSVAATPPPPLDRKPTPSVEPATEIREVPIPISGSVWPRLKAGFPLTEDAWNQMLRVLEAMKPGLVQPNTDA